MADVVMAISSRLGTVERRAYQVYWRRWWFSLATKHLHVTILSADTLAPLPPREFSGSQPIISCLILTYVQGAAIHLRRMHALQIQASCGRKSPVGKSAAGAFEGKVTPRGRPK